MVLTGHYLRGKYKLHLCLKSCLLSHGDGNHNIVPSDILLQTLGSFAEGKIGKLWKKAAFVSVIICYVFDFFPECGAAFTSKLEGMFKDMELSKDIMIQFKQVFTGSDHFSHT